MGYLVLALAEYLTSLEAAALELEPELPECD